MKGGGSTFVEYTSVGSLVPRLTSPYAEKSWEALPYAEKSWEALEWG